MSENASAWADLTGRTLTKGQGTGNDFIFITDPKAEAVLDADLVARVCDRHFGLGADGFIRAAHTETFSTGQKILENTPKPPGSWITATPTARSQKCAGTVCAPSLSICAPRG